MEKRMTVAISQRQDRNAHGTLVDSLESTYPEYYTKFGILLVPIPNQPNLTTSYLEALAPHAIILSGGNDVDPKRYGSSFESASVSADRDRTEQHMLDYAIRHRIPVLGICRGMQFINVFFGGTLCTDLKSLNRGVEHVRANHDLQLIEMERIAARTTVNSYHNMGILEENLSPQLSYFARASDGSIEGIYHPNLPIAAIMWHPERKSPDSHFNEKLLNLFVKQQFFWGAR